jgi:glycerol-3-phosphate acyltransferase PlsX
VSSASDHPIAIALDAMGGDHSPGAIVEGVRLLGEDFDGRIFLVGKPEVIEECGPLPPYAEVVPSEQVVGMHESPSSALRKKRGSSVARAVQLVKDGQAQAVVSAGNTGAFMAFAARVLGRLPGIKRPAIATLMPSAIEPCIVIDVGANVDCRPDFLLDFAVMGSVFVEKALGREKPRVGLLSIGEEEGKGNELTFAAKPLLQNSPLNFIGNVEGRDIFSGNVDVVVCDGFVGNVILKFGEGLSEMIFRKLREVFAQVQEQRQEDSSEVGRCVFKNLVASTDYSEYGGAPLLGTNGCCIVCHGKSTPKAIANAIRAARRAIKFEVNQTIIEVVEQVHQGDLAFDGQA